MANKPLRPCRYPGCYKLTNDGWCELHRPAKKKAEKRESADWHWMYLTKTWKEDLRPGQLLREPFCRECAKHGLRVPATRVDHVIPHRGDWERFIDREGLQSLCESCHNRKTAKEMAERVKKRQKI